MGKVISGARVIFRINNAKVAYASNVSYNETINVEDINVLDNIAPVELAETGYIVDFTCTSFITQDDTIKTLGIMPQFENILTAGVLSADIADSVSGKAKLLLTGVKCLGRSGTVDARGVYTETWNFRGLKEQVA